MGIWYLNTHVLPAHRASLWDGGFCAYMYMFSWGDSAQAEVLPKDIFVYSQICVLIYMFLKTKLCPSGDSVQEHIYKRLRICNYTNMFLRENPARAKISFRGRIHVNTNSCYMYMFLRGNSAQAEVLSKNIFVYSQIYVLMYMFLRGNSAQMETPLRTYP